MPVFAGFTASESFIPLPESLIRELANIHDLNELKVILYILWRVTKIEGGRKSVSRNEISLDYDLMKGFENGEALDNALQRSVEDGYLLSSGEKNQKQYFLNSPGGKISLNSFDPDDAVERSPLSTTKQKPNVFSLYEQNIGPLTPLISEALIDDEKTFTAGWVADAMEVAVKMNKRNLKYIEAILRRWKEDGRAEEPIRRNAQKSGSTNRSLRKIQDLLKPRDHE